MLKQWLDAPADGRSLLASIEAALRRYLYFRDDRVYLFLSLWIAGTYMYSAFRHYGHFHMYSSEPQSGKNQVQALIQHLAFEATRPLNARTRPEISDCAAEGGTVQLDTLERWQEKNRDTFKAAMELLYAAFRADGTVAIRVPEPTHGCITQTLTVYAPCSITSVRKHFLDDPILERAFSIEMKRKRVPRWTGQNRPLVDTSKPAISSLVFETD